MATLTGLIPVTVGTFEAYHGGGGWGGGGYHWGGGGGLGTQSAGPYIYIYMYVYTGFIYEACGDITPMMENQIGKNM